MTKKTSTSKAAVEDAVVFDRETIARGIAKLQKRIEDLRALSGLEYEDQLVRNAEHAVQRTILEVFGERSHEYQHNRSFELYTRLLSPDRYRMQTSFEERVPQKIVLLEGLIKDLEERRDELGATTTLTARTTFAGMKLHPRIDAAVRKLFMDGHYRNAVLDGVLALQAFVQEKTGRTEDGLSLMRTAFSKDKPLLAVNDGASVSEKNEQEGVMHLLEGAVLAFRNPRAHGLEPDEADEAAEAIAFFSMLARFIDGSKVTP
jgi:uncharacterized protein (TIGR02391 family)